MRNQITKKILILIGLGVYSFLLADFVEGETKHKVTNTMTVDKNYEQSQYIYVMETELSDTKIKYDSLRKSIEPQKKEQPFDIENVIKLGKRYRLSHLDVVVAQMIEESANLKSSLFKTQNNMFGMKVAGKRPTTAIGSNASGYAKYRDPEMSLLDYALYQAAFNRTKDRKVYLQNLADSYADAHGYVQRLEAIIKTHNLKERCL